MKLWIICHHKSEFGMLNQTGKHIDSPSDAEIFSAIDECLTAGLRTLHIYGSKRRTSSDVARMITDAWPDQIIGWSDFLYSEDGFLMDTNKTWVKRLVNFD